MFDIIFCAAGASESILRWRHIGTRITGLFDELSLPSLNRAITLTASFAGRDRLKFQNATARWAAAVLAVQYSKPGWLQRFRHTVTGFRCDSLRTHVPVDVWTLLKKRPSLPPMHWERSVASERLVFHRIRGLGDIETLKSYLLIFFQNGIPFTGMVLRE